MSARLVALVALFLAGVWFASCSSGLGNDPRRQATAAAANPNLPLGFDPGFLPSDALAEPAVAGVVVPAIGAQPAREVILLAFSTAATSDAGDGTPLSRDTTTDANDAADVFVAAISAQDVERRAFSQALAGKFRHPRCVTCHSMTAIDSQAFASAAQPHAGALPGAGFPILQAELCAPCHVTSSTFPVEGWQAPGPTFDFRGKDVAQLAQMARNVPVDDLEHFVGDRRVLWALDSGILPQVGGRNGIADDDHDGVAEPADEDGVPRTVPGGSASFVQQIEEWHATATGGPGTEVLTTAAAVRDVTLVSRASGTTAAANGSSTRPNVLWVANPGFDPANAAATNPIGTLYVAFESTASNLDGGDANGESDVFRAAVQLRAEEDATGAASAGGLNLLTLPGTLLCSARDGSATAGNGASSRPVLGGANAEIIAFESLATNLVSPFTDGNGADSADVYVRNVGPSGGDQLTSLISHALGGTSIGGDGTSQRPALSSDGSTVAFESDATDLIDGDDNALRDIYYAATGGGPTFGKQRASVGTGSAQAAGGSSRNASVQVAGGRMLVAFESDATSFADGLLAATNVYLFDSDVGAARLLNRSTAGAGTIGDGAARAPVLSADGSLVAFESDADNIDVLRPDDHVGTDVFLVETAQVQAGRVLPFRISVTVTDGGPASGASHGVALGTLAGSEAFPTGVAAYRTAADNLGASDGSDLVLVFLDETSGVVADFDVSVASGPPPLTVTFTDRSSGSPTAWQWDFGNDSVVDSTEQNPTRTFTAPGDYAVRLVAPHQPASGTVTRNAAFRVLGPPVVDFAASATVGAPPFLVQFTDLSTDEPFEWLWDFGDGTTTNLQNPSHQYTALGDYTVTLTATGPGGTGTATKTDFIRVSFAPPDVTIVATPSSGTAPISIDFSITNSGGPITSFAWDFDDPGSGGANTSTLSAPSHSYDFAGNYTVSLTATGPGGSSSPTLAVDLSAPTWTTIFALFNADGCRACHTTPLAGGAPFSMLNTAVGHANLINVASTTGTCTPTPRVTPGNPNASTLVDRIAGTSCGSSMGGLTPEQIQAVRAWIQAGALND